MKRLVLALLVLVAGCTTADPPTPNPLPTPGPSGSSDVTALRRPWAQPPVPAGQRCPVTTVREQPDPALAPLLGNGPARPTGLGAGAVLDYVAPGPGTVWVDKTWGGQKVLWAIDPTAVEPILVRGHRLDGPGELAFEDPAIPELVFHTSNWQGRSGGWHDHPSHTRVRISGCYAYQIDSPAGTWSVVFRANGPKI